MTALTFVDVATARAARGVRMLVSGFVPSPWSEAAKGLFLLQGVPVMAVRYDRENAEHAAWGRSHNVPVVLNDDEPPRTSWSDVVALADRLARDARASAGLLPTDIEARSRTVGLIHEIAGEGGLGWSSRLLMLEASFQSGGARGFPLPVAQYLGAKYGYATDRMAGARTRIREILGALRRELGAKDYFGVDTPNALDVYSACFLTPLGPIDEADCPRMSPALRRAFAIPAEELGAEVGTALLGHRKRVLERHLGWPIAI